MLYMIVEHYEEVFEPRVFNVETSLTEELNLCSGLQWTENLGVLVLEERLQVLDSVRLCSPLVLKSAVKRLKNVQNVHQQ